MQKHQSAPTSDRKLKTHLAHKCCSVGVFTSTAVQVAIKVFFLFSVEDIICCWAIHVYWKALGKTPLKRPESLQSLLLLQEDFMPIISSYTGFLKTHLAAPPSFYSQSTQVFWLVTGGFLRLGSQSIFSKRIQEKKQSSPSALQWQFVPLTVFFVLSILCHICHEYSRVPDCSPVEIFSL